MSQRWQAASEQPRIPTRLKAKDSRCGEARRRRRWTVMETSGRPLLPFQGEKKKWIYWKRYLWSEYVQFTKTQTCKTNKWTGRKCKTMWKRRVQQCAVGGNSCTSEKKWLAVFMSTYFTLKGIIQQLQNATGQGQVVISTATMWICLKYWAIPRKTTLKFLSLSMLTLLKIFIRKYFNQKLEL